MRAFFRLYCPALLLLFLASTSFAQISRSTIPSRQVRAQVTDGPMIATATPIVRVTTENPREINLGKPATFVFAVSNEGKVAATGVVIATTIPDHVELTSSDPKPLNVEGLVHRFEIGDLAPGVTRRVTLIAVPRSIAPIKMDSTVMFATSTRSSVMVRRPQLALSAEVLSQVVINKTVEWTVKVTNTGDGRADNVVVTPTLVDGEVKGNALRQAIPVGTLKPGDTKEVQFTVVPTRKGKVSATFKGTNPDGLEANHESSFHVMQAELAVKAMGPQVQPMARNGAYEVHVTNPGDAPTDSTLVSIKIPAGLEITSAAQNAYNEEARLLRWRITTVRPNDVVKLRFQAESISEGPQMLNVVAKADQIPEATTTYTTNVISRPNPIVTVSNDQEFSAVGEPITFKVHIINAGSKTADDLRIRAALSEKLEVIESSDYDIASGQVEFPVQTLASGQKVTLLFRAKGREAGEHRVRVLVDGVSLTSSLTFESTAVCYVQEQPTEEEAGRTAQGYLRRTYQPR